MSVMDSKFLGTWHEKCHWSALLVTDLMCSSTSVIYLELCSDREGIGLCCNWNILSCACLHLDRCLADKLVHLRFFLLSLMARAVSLILTTLLVDYPYVYIAVGVFHNASRKQFSYLILPNAKIFLSSFPLITQHDLKTAKWDSIKKIMLAPVKSLQPSWWPKYWKN